MRVLVVPKRRTEGQLGSGCPKVHRIPDFAGLAALLSTRVAREGHAAGRMPQREGRGYWAARLSDFKANRGRPLPLATQLPALHDA
jgi:hypothetical protein